MHSHPTIASTVEHSCLARQPILDRRGNVFGYELLFRRSPAAQLCDAVSGDLCEKVVVDALHSIGLDVLAGSRRAFINVTRDFLLSGAVTLMPPERVVIELLEEIEGDDEVLAVCRALKQKGYTLALDDFVRNDRTARLMQVADFIKVDFLAFDTRASRQAVIEGLRPGGQRLVAEKVETPEQHDEAVAEGFTHFQGYYFGRPAVREVKRIPGRQAAYATLLVQLSDPDLTMRELTDVIKHDASLSHRVLRAVNSAGTPLRVEIDSIQQAVMLLGMGTIRRWASLWAIASMNEAAHPELVTGSIIRARCCELLEASESSGSRGFLLGICSLLDAILEQPMEVVLEQLPISGEIRAALLGETNRSRALLECVAAFERGEWERSDTFAGHAGVAAAVLPAAYRDALCWARDFGRVAG